MIHTSGHHRPGAAGTHSLDFNERKSVLDALHLLLLLFAALVPATLWFLRLSDVDLPQLAASSALFVAAQFLASTAIDRSSRPARRETALAWLHLSTVPFLLYTWNIAGNLDVPLFLAALTVPVITAHLVRARMHALVTAVVAVVGVIYVALSAEPELRWFLEQRGVPAGWLGYETGRPRAYAGLDILPAFHIAGLTCYAVFLLTLAVGGETVLSAIVRIRDRFRASERALAKSEGLFHSAFAETPAPTALVYADSLQILHVSRSLVQRMLLTPQDVPGKRLVDLVAFADSDSVARWLASTRGGSRIVAYRVGPQERIAELLAASFTEDETRYLRLELKEFDAPRHLASAVEAGRGAALVVGADSRVRFHNTAAATLFGAIENGDHAAEFLQRLGLPLHPGHGDEGGSVEFVHEIEGRSFRVRVENLTIADDERVSLLSVTPHVDKQRLGGAKRESAFDLFSARSFNEGLVRELAVSAGANPLTSATLGLAGFAENGRWTEPDIESLRSFLAALDTKLERRDLVAVLQEGRVSVFLPGRSAAEGRAVLDEARGAWESQRPRGATTTERLALVVAVVSLGAEDDLDEITRRGDAALDVAVTHRETAPVSSKVST